MFDSATPQTAARQASLSFTISRGLLKLMSIKSMMSSNHLILYCHFLLLPSIFPSIRDFSNESVLPIRWPKYWSFSFSISPSSEYSGLISFRIDWFDLLADSYQKLNLLAPSSRTSQSPELLEINICCFSHLLWAICNGSFSKLIYMYIRPIRIAN